jgi:hypothetical protein
LEERKGLGLGLYICKDLVTRQGGKIWAKSVPGQGSVFSVTLPVFSLPKLLRPAFDPEGHADGLITVVVTEIGSHTGWLSNDVRADQCRGIRDLLRGCLHSDLDIVMPKMDSTGPAELFFMVAFTDQIGGEAISKRIRKRLDRSEPLQQAGLTHSTSYRSPEPLERKSTERLEDFLETVATGVQDLMNEEISSRQVLIG